MQEKRRLIQKACDQLEEAIRAVRQGLSRMTRAVAAPTSMHRRGDGEGGLSIMQEVRQPK